MKETRTERVSYRTEKEEMVLDLLIKVGMKKNPATVLIYLDGAIKAGSREIERGTGLRQPEISIAMQELEKRDWVTHCDGTAGKTGRPSRIYTLAKPVSDILGEFENAKREELETMLAAVKKVKTYT